MTRIRRGVSPVIATVLLILVAVAATVIIWTWVSGAASNNPTAQPALQEKITIDAVQYIGANNTAIVYITNTGQVNVDIVSAYILNATTGTVVCGGPLTTPVSISAQSSGKVLLNCVLTAGEPYVAKAVTANGISATYNFNG